MQFVRERVHGRRSARSWPTLVRRARLDYEGFRRLCAQVRKELELRRPPRSLAGPLLTKCRPGRDKRRAGLGRLQLSVPAATHRTGIWPLPHRSENAKTACIMGFFRGFEAASEELLTRLTGFRADHLTPQVNPENRPLVNRFGRGTGAHRGAFGGSSVGPMDSDARRWWGRELFQHHHFSLYS